MKRKILVIMATISLLFQSNTFAIGEVKPLARRCEPYILYNEKSISRTREVQFTHMAYSSPISSHVSHSVTLNSSLHLKAGISADMNLLLSKSSIDFEMGYTGTRQSNTTITWNINAGGNYKLIAGKEISDVMGEVLKKDSYCNFTKRTISVKGSYLTFHTAIKVK